jgi:hypothetical protein
MMECSIGAPKEGLIMMLAPACADSVAMVTLERELLQLQQLRQCILEGLPLAYKGDVNAVDSVSNSLSWIGPSRTFGGR